MHSFQGWLSPLVFLCHVQWVTSKAVQFELNLTWENHEVAGATRKMVRSNGQFPGPTLRLEQGMTTSSWLTIQFLSEPQSIFTVASSYTRR
jgi:hypothetical protein